jgi:uncharacterized protein (DUF1800 family)
VPQPVVFREPAHEPGERIVMGVRYRDGGKAQSAAILSDLAAKPATARFVCAKIARHFVADDPPRPLWPGWRRPGWPPAATWAGSPRA